MSLIKFFLGEKKGSASVAKERLQIILAHERAAGSTATPMNLDALKREILEVIARHMQIPLEAVQLEIDKAEGVDVLEMKAELPSSA